jgi:RNA-directed DNA polymerase
VFAADFRDRVVHHVLVNHLEKIWEPIFIHDSYACRKGKGVHAAVARLQTFMRKATANGTREAFTLQLDIRNYFMTIDKPRLLAMINAKLPNTTEENKGARWRRTGAYVIQVGYTEYLPPSGFATFNQG